MRALLLSDIHANHVALEAVLRDARRFACDRVLCLGDVLGYGPHPREVLGRLRELEADCVLGNHDAWALQLARGEPGVREGGVVGQALGWQLAQLDAAELAWVAGWPELRDEPLGALGEVRLRHGSPASMTTYVDTLASAREAFAAWPGRLALVGHTHLPGVYATLNTPSGEWTRHQALQAGESFAVPPTARVILNPGSVGQPRDGDARASYAVLDAGRASFRLHRVEYDVNAVRVAVRAAGLPEVLGARLAVGQ